VTDSGETHHQGATDATVHNESSARILHNFTNISHRGGQLRIIAACRSLGMIGYADTPLDQIARVPRSVLRWIESIRMVIDADISARFFPAGAPSLQQIHRLATLHDKPVRPPKRFVLGTFAGHARRRTPHSFKEARATSDALRTELDAHQHWIKPSLPMTDVTTASIRLLLSNRTVDRWSLSRLRTALELKPYLKPGNTLARAITSGNLEKLLAIVERICRFEQHAHYHRLLGPDFRGIETPWQDLAVKIGFSQALLDILQDSAVTGDIISHWDHNSESLYALARAASSASSRGRKLSRLANRLYRVKPATGHLVACGRKSADRLALWVRLIESAEPTHHAWRYLTPRQVLQQMTATHLSPTKPETVATASPQLVGAVRAQCD